MNGGMLHVERFLIEVMTGFQAKLLLLCVFAARGTSFLFSKVLLRSMSPENVLAVRFLLSFAVLAVVFHKKMRSIYREVIHRHAENRTGESYTESLGDHAGL